jgi:hypothetical protein
MTPTSTLTTGSRNVRGLEQVAGVREGTAASYNEAFDNDVAISSPSLLWPEGPHFRPASWINKMELISYVKGVFSDCTLTTHCTPGWTPKVSKWKDIAPSSPGGDE